MQAGDDKVVFDNGQVLHREQCWYMFGDWIHSIVDFGQSLHRMSLDLSSLACMSALAMITRKSNACGITGKILLCVVWEYSCKKPNFSLIYDTGSN